METSTLYKGERKNAVKHILHAYHHGFTIARTGAPFIMADGLVGNAEQEVVINGKMHDSVKIAKEILSADALLVVSHPTGHIAECQNCKKCSKWCTQDAIIINV